MKKYLLILAIGYAITIGGYFLLIHKVPWLNVNACPPPPMGMTTSDCDTQEALLMIVFFGPIFGLLMFNEKKETK